MIKEYYDTRKTRKLRNHRLTRNKRVERRAWGVERNYALRSTPNHSWLHF